MRIILKTVREQILQKNDLAVLRGGLSPRSNQRERLHDASDLHALYQNDCKQHNRTHCKQSKEAWRHTLQNAKWQALRTGNQQPGINTVDGAFCPRMVLRMLQQLRHRARIVGVIEDCFLLSQAARLAKRSELEEE